MERIATERGVGMATVALAWVLKNPVVNTPINGATKAKHLTDAFAALELILNNEEVAALEAPYTPASPRSSNPIKISTTSRRRTKQVRWRDGRTQPI